MNNPIKQDTFVAEADRPRVVTDSRINTPTLVILLGSTPARASLEVMRQMLTLSPEDRRRVAFIHIDTDETPSDLVAFRRRYNGMFLEFPLRIAVPAGISYGRRERQPVSNPYPNPNDELLELHTFIKGKDPQYFASGAGGIRNNGHVAACFHHQAIYDTLDSALVAVTRVDESNNGKRANEVQVNIVAFLGGGTGSGILTDIAVIMRDLLTNYLYKQRINIFCMLPEPVREASQTDLSWRKSNATACLLEMEAYSLAANGSKTPGRYRKYMRDKVYYLSNNAIANEVYLIGHSAMGDSEGTARIVGLDLFQRITDASGVGFLEHSKWVDRRTLGESDDRGLPTMFGTSCPLEIRFPSEETATAFARISAARLLPLLASYQPKINSVSDGEKADWVKKWDGVARVEDSNDPNTIKITPFVIDEFADADQYRLNSLWAKLERREQEIEKNIKEVLDLQRGREHQSIQSVPTLAPGGITTSLLNARIQHLQNLRLEYTLMRDTMLSREAQVIPSRPVDLEADLVQPGTWLFRIRNFGRDYAYDVYSAYNDRLNNYAHGTRHRLLMQLLEHLIHLAEETLNSILSWQRDAQVTEHQQDLAVSGRTSMAWQGHLDYQHPHQQHIFDLRQLRSGNGRNIAVERLYLWATGGDKALSDGADIDYNSYVNRCVDYLTNTMNDAYSARQQNGARLEAYSAGRLADRVVDFFHDHYMHVFQDMNIFELFERAMPVSSTGLARNKQISEYLLEHLQYIRNLMASLIAFEAELWSQGLTTLDTSIYLGMHWRNGYQRGVLDQALDNLGPLTRRGQTAIVETSIDPHRLQLVYGQHAISLSTVRDFYLDQNSSMAAYLYHQSKWEGGGTAVSGYMPVHSSSETQWLVRESKTLGYHPPTSLFKRVIRTPFEP